MCHPSYVADSRILDLPNSADINCPTSATSPNLPLLFLITSSLHIKLQTSFINGYPSQKQLIKFHPCWN
uniref:Uncharacterized protein n=1 Tax=Manihot esculenta TaxID=3983 RepID=A0A2C9ULH7_MANES